MKYQISEIVEFAETDPDRSVAALGEVRDNLHNLSDEQLVELARAERTIAGEEASATVDEFEKRMIAYGAPAARVAAAQIDYIGTRDNPNETIKQFAERVRDDEEWA